MWRLNACLRLIPLPVFLKRLAAPRRVFNLMIASCSFLTRIKHLYQVKLTCLSKNPHHTGFFALRWEAVFYQKSFVNARYCYH